MFNQYEPNVKATIAFLRLISVKVNNETVNESLQNHPDWPSLLCISDSLNKWHIRNAAGRIANDDIDKLPAPFIAYTRRKEAPLSIVTNVSKTHITYHTTSLRKSVTQTREEFFKKWAGVYLIAETTDKSGEDGYEKNKRKFFINSILPFLLTMGAFGILAYTFFGTIAYSVQSKNISIASLFQFFILLSGVIVTSLLLWYELDKNNPILNKVCSGIAKGNCNAILTGKRAKVFSWLSWSEIGFFYFTGCFLILIFAGADIANSVHLLSWLSLLALPYTLFSIFYQWRIPKQWCILCLAVQALLVLGAVNVFQNHLLVPFSFTTALTVKFLSSFIAIILAWFCVKPYILRLQQAKNTKREYLRIKFNVEIFDTLLKKQKAITLPTNDLGVDMGNPNAKNTLIKVCNPYCGPCSKAHQKIEELLKEHENLHVKIIFTAPNEENNLMFKPVRHFLAIAEQRNDELTKQALDDWYLTDEKEYESFAAKYPINKQSTQLGDKIEAMNKWCKAMEIDYTPTVFINGYKLPEAYNIEDLQYFLLE